MTERKPYEHHFPRKHISIHTALQLFEWCVCACKCESYEHHFPRKNVSVHIALQLFEWCVCVCKCESYVHCCPRKHVSVHASLLFFFLNSICVCVSVSHVCTVFWKVTFLCTCHEWYVCVWVCECQWYVCVCECVRHTCTIFHETRFRAYVTHIFSEWYVCVWECESYVHRCPSKPISGHNLHPAFISST